MTRLTTPPHALQMRPRTAQHSSATTSKAGPHRHVVLFVVWSMKYETAANVHLSTLKRCFAVVKRVHLMSQTAGAACINAFQNIHVA